MSDEGDRRVTRLRLTARGERLVDRVVAAWVDADRVAGQSLSARDQRALIRLLGKLTESATAHERPA
jgi:DNA-binding MarR family transcriptional regulator